MYKCVKCKKVVSKLGSRVRCPYCGYKIFVKLRPNAVKRVRAR